MGLQVTLNNALPSGCIVLWSGSIVSIPSDWALCDGNNGTPNLRDRFIVGAGTSYAVDATGGESTHTLTVAEMPSHSHNVVTATTGISTPHVISGASNAGTTNYSTTSEGSGNPHNNLPPYYALAYIMKL